MRRNRRSSCLSPDISCSSDRQGSLVILPRLSCFDLTRLPMPPLSPVESAVFPSDSAPSLPKHFSALPLLARSIRLKIIPLRKNPALGNHLS